MATIRWNCVDCGHEVYATTRPAPIRWSDGHVCRFREAEPVQGDDIFGGREPYDEADYHRHLSGEGSRAWNEHPDGCFFCGGDHHSDSCPERY